jgi:hypothetical protein
LSVLVADGIAAGVVVGAGVIVEPVSALGLVEVLGAGVVIGVEFVEAGA